MNETIKYKLKKPEYSDNADIEVLNDNMDIIETVLNKKADKEYVDNRVDSIGITDLATKQQIIKVEEKINKSNIDTNNKIVSMGEDVKRTNKKLDNKADLLVIQNLEKNINNKVNREEITELIKNKADKSEVIKNLSDLKEDSKHNTVTIEEKNLLSNYSKDFKFLNSYNGLLSNIEKPDDLLEGLKSEQQFYSEFLKNKCNIFPVDNYTSEETIPKDKATFISSLGMYCNLGNAYGEQISSKDVIEVLQTLFSNLSNLQYKKEFKDFYSSFISMLKSVSFKGVANVSDETTNIIVASSFQPTFLTLVLFTNELLKQIFDKMENSYIPQKVLSESEYNSLSSSEKNENILYFIKK